MFLNRISIYLVYKKILGKSYCWLFYWWSNYLYKQMTYKYLWLIRKDTLWLKGAKGEPTPFLKSLSGNIHGEITSLFPSRETHGWERTYPQDSWLSFEEIQQRAMRPIGKRSQYSFFRLDRDGMGRSFDLEWWIHDLMANSIKRWNEWTL